ncbi:MAG TPA: hypothetical protein VK841_12220 [Polyangiaceae bacterium]|jgi:hypothetical protein|nr:hypothetical protein [Polyangiaceae bacterium]
MSDRPEPSRPPSDPQPSRRRTEAFAGEDRPIRTQLVLGLLLGLLLLATGLYVWRRPHAAGESGPDEASSGSPLDAEDAAVHLAAVDAEATNPAVVVSGTRTVGCHDRGPKHTLPDECDHLAAVEQALAHAVEQSAECAAPVEKGSTIEYVADVSFSRKKWRVLLPKAGRTVHDRKVVVACSSAVREAMEAALPKGALENLEHQHARYEIAVTATYRGKG